MNTRIRDLKGLGPKSEAQLTKVGIDSVARLREVGAVTAFVSLLEADGVKPSLNFLYALVGALENRDWRDVVKKDRDSLIFELEGRSELDKLISESGKSDPSCPL